MSKDRVSLQVERTGKNDTKLLLCGTHEIERLKARNDAEMVNEKKGCLIVEYAEKQAEMDMEGG